MGFMLLMGLGVGVCAGADDEAAGTLAVGLCCTKTAADAVDEAEDGCVAGARVACVAGPLGCRNTTNQPMASKIITTDTISTMLFFCIYNNNFNSDFQYIT